MMAALPGLRHETDVAGYRDGAWLAGCVCGWHQVWSQKREATRAAHGHEWEYYAEICQDVASRRAVLAHWEAMERLRYGGSLGSLR